MSTGDSAVPEPSGLRVLVVEDEIMVALLLQDMITDLGHRVVGPVGRLGKALEMATSEAIDMAILDVNLDGEEVYPVADALAARHIPFAFVTGYGRDGLREPYCASPILAKPFHERHLRGLFEEMGCGKQH